MAHRMEGQEVPNASLTIMREGTLSTVNTKDIFAGKKIVVFGLPGAYTPTCTNSHVPGYEEMYDTFKSIGIDEVYCTAVNDSFVLKAWGIQLGIENVKFLGDGNEQLAKGLGMNKDFSALGFGSRTKRYSMYVENGTIKKMFEEPNKEGDPFEVSDARTMIKYLKPDVKLPARIAIFTKIGCPFCHKAKCALEGANKKYKEVLLTDDKRMVVLSAMGIPNTVPQVFVDGKHIGGSEQLIEYLKSC